MVRVKKQYKDKQLSELLKIISVKIKAYRQELDLSQNQLAKLSGVALSTINEIENLVVRDVRLSTLTTLAKFLKQNPIDLMVGSNIQLPEDDKNDLIKIGEQLGRIIDRLT